MERVVEMVKKVTDWKYFIICVLALFIPIMAFFGVVISIVHTSEMKNVRTLALSREADAVEIRQQILIRDLRRIAGDLRTISNLHDLRELAAGTGHDSVGLANDLYHISLNTGLYDQIRYLDTTGTEIVRVNYNKGNPVIVPKEKLQNKGKRYYFMDTFKLKEGEIFVSPLDLNIEQGKIEQPLKPMIRFGMPLFSKDGKKTGIVLLNYFGARMIDDLVHAVSQGNGQFSLLNSKGYWLKGPNPDDEWGFMYKDRSAKTFGNKFPDEWDRIEKAESGQFQSDNGVFTFATSYPLEESQKSSDGSSEAFSSSSKSVEGRDFFFKIVSHIPIAVLVENSQKFLNKIIHILIAIGCISLLGSIALAYFMENRRRANKERQLLLEDLQKAVDEIKTLQGVIPICSYCKKMRDDEGVWNRLELYISNHSDADFSHGICPECMTKQMDALKAKKKEKDNASGESQNGAAH